ncbi:winged helix-turn-helix domain-containing protein [Arthrobacter koreensis]|uniref:winged helix-turn-helix domain-containing protein n=1 Tax=Arthrobacter koreensis TaxID=199136 RepID=UPI0036D79971
MPAAFSLDRARRTILGAQQLAKPRPVRPTPGQTGRVFDALGLLQIDSVNVLARSHYLPLFTRLGAYDRDVLDRMASRHPRRMVEYWAHEASFIRPDLFADLRQWQRRTWMRATSMPEEPRSELSKAILELLDHKHPLTAREVEAALGQAAVPGTKAWGWNWSASKQVLEDLFEQGLISSAGRGTAFERLYAPAATVHPDGEAALEPADRREALLRLTENSARSLGLGTAPMLADYFRLPLRDTLAAAQHLARQGELEEISVAGWKGPVFLHPAATTPRRCHGRGLLSPFDSLVFDRRRLQAVFGIHYRIEIYTPAHKRQFGYYVLPFLLREAIVARVDLKADRAGRVLLVQAAHAEPGSPADTAVELAAELRIMAQWLGLAEVMVSAVGNLAPALKLAIDRG